MVRKKNKNKPIELKQEELPKVIESIEAIEVKPKTLYAINGKKVMDFSCKAPDVPRETRIKTGFKDKNNVDIHVGDTLRSISKADPRRYKVYLDKVSEAFMVMNDFGEVISSLKFFLMVGTEPVSKKVKAEIVT